MDDFAIVLENPKFPFHVGGAVRLAACYGGRGVIVTGTRCKEEVDNLRRLPREERMKDYQDVELIWHANHRPLDEWGRHTDFTWTPVCVEVDPGAELMPHFIHPPRAIYVFGPEDGDVSRGLRTACHRFVTIPSLHCLNLGMAIGTTLYDRKSKQMMEVTV